jgi:hypothetical protein
MNIKQMLYLGAKCHIEPTIHFPEAKDFIFIDVQPRSEFDNKSFYFGFYRPNFVDELIYKCSQLNFKLTETIELNPQYYKSIFSWKQRLYYSLFCSVLPKYINPTLLIFKNNITDQTIKYYISTNIEYNMCTKLERDIKESNGLIVSGYHPNVKVLEYFTYPKIFFGYTGTCYENDADESDNVINLLHTKFKSIYFKSYFLVSTQTGLKIKCDDIHHLLNLEKKNAHNLHYTVDSTFSYKF